MTIVQYSFGKGLLDSPPPPIFERTPWWEANLSWQATGVRKFRHESIVFYLW